MLAVCFAPPSKEHDCNHWSCVLTHFEVGAVYLLRPPPGEAGKLHGIRDGVLVESAADLPADVPLILCMPPNGRVYQGVTPLADFEHPADAIYMFGPDHQIVEETTLGGREPDHVVYVETATAYEMYSHVAAAVILHDRYARG